MSDLKTLITDLASRYHQDTIEIRRHLHQHPELSKQEEKTAAYICEVLGRYGIPHKNGVGGFGVVGLIEGKNPAHRCIGLRADMDALPVIEQNDLTYASLEKGKMHACGHDVHMSSLLGTARILNELKGQFEGTVKLMFQPSEESYPGGAIEMINEGVLEKPDVWVVLGQHVMPTLDAGTVGFNPGPDMASTDEIYLTVKGKGGHAAVPQLVVDPIVIAAHIITALQQIVSRNADPGTPTVLSFGRIIGEGRTNIIPNEVNIDGTVRTYDEAWRKEVHKRVESIATSIATGMGGSCEVRIAHGYPYLHNDEELTVQLQSLATEYLGEENVIELEKRMTAEDFAYFAQRVPSCLYRLGVKNEERGINSFLHSPTFDVDEKSLETGSGLMAWLTINLLAKD
ncbi:MAG: amidohydrolase [Bacteroidales bacterium]|nr:amidohydrolase [Bacteroidales bacterium]